VCFVWFLLFGLSSSKRRREKLVFFLVQRGGEEAFECEPKREALVSNNTQTVNH